MAHRFRSGAGEHLLVVPFSRIFDLSADDAITLDPDPDTLCALVASCAEAAPGEAALDQIVEPEPQSISLNVSSSCNLGCAYCYAARGSFGGAQSATMTWPVAQAAITGCSRSLGRIVRPRSASSVASRLPTES
jgi:uncharacterized protein